MLKAYPRCRWNIYLYENNTVYNPYIGNYSKSTCRKYKYLNPNLFYEDFPKTQISIIRNIIKLLLDEEINGLQIYEIMKNVFY